jgi:hypothetical protein
MKPDETRDDNHGQQSSRDDPAEDRRITARDFLDATVE